MKYLVDTTVLIDSLRGNIEARSFLKQKNPKITAITIAELVHGSRDQKELNSTLVLCDSLHQVEIGNKIIEFALKLLYKFYLSNGLKFWDAVIASCAIENKLILVTDNIKHFKFIKELELLPQEEAFKQL